MQSEIAALTIRIARLERANRQLKVLGAGSVLALAALLSMGFATKPRTIEAEKIVIRDSHGRARLTIGTPKVAGFAGGLGPDEPAIWLSDENGTDRTNLTEGGLYFANDRGQGVLEITSDPRPELRLHGPDGKVSWSAP
jgi:hypothetical protein